MKNLSSQLHSEWAGTIQLTRDRRTQFLQLTAWRLEGGYRRPSATFVLRVDHLAQNLQAIALLELVAEAARTFVPREAGHRVCQRSQ